AASSFGQNKGGGGTTGTGSTGAGTTGTGTTGTTGTGATTTGRPTNPTNPNPTQPTPNVSIPQPIFISGRVVMEDGTALTEPLVIETDCNGVGHSEGYTHAKGDVEIELGANRGVNEDASESSTSYTNPALPL